VIAGWAGKCAEPSKKGTMAASKLISVLLHQSKRDIRSTGVKPMLASNTKSATCLINRPVKSGQVQRGTGWVQVAVLRQVPMT
jgi:hypothetical protein